MIDLSHAERRAHSRLTCASEEGSRVVEELKKDSGMRIQMVDAVVDPGNDEAPLTYTVDGQEKQITWAALDQLYLERHAETDQHHTQEQKLLAQIVHDHWIDSDDWWEGASASSPASENTPG